MTNATRTNRARSIAGNILMFLPGFAVLTSEMMKFLHVPAMVQPMAAAGFSEGKLLFVATLGTLSAVLFLYRRTRSLGLLLLSSFLGGAICLHVTRDEFAKALGPGMLLAFAWVGTWLRHPQAVWSFASPLFEASQAGQHSLTSREA